METLKTPRCVCFGNLANDPHVDEVDGATKGECRNAHRHGSELTVETEVVAVYRCVWLVMSKGRVTDC